MGRLMSPGKISPLQQLCLSMNNTVVNVKNKFNKLEVRAIN